MPPYHHLPSSNDGLTGEVHSTFQCYHPGAGIVFLAFPSHFAPNILYILDLLPTMYSFLLMANMIKNNSPYRIIHSHRMTLSRQKTVFVLYCQHCLLVLGGVRDFASSSS
jgi:hypothetical protein